MKQQRYITIQEAALAASVSDRTVRRWLALGRLTRFETPAGDPRVNPAELISARPGTVATGRAS